MKANINQLASFSLISVQWHKYNKTYLDNFIPLFCTMFIDQKISKIEIKDYGTLVSQFNAIYSIDLPSYIIQPIIEKLCQQELISQELISYKVNTDKIFDNHLYIADIQRQCREKQNDVIKAFRVYTQERFNKIFTDTDAIRLLSKFIMRHDISLFFDESIVWSEDILADEEYYLAGSFIKELNDNNSTMYQTIVELAVGNIAFNALQMTFLPTEVETLKKCVVFLDASHLFPLLGVDQNERLETIELMIKTIHTKGGFVKIYKHTYDEVKEILESAKKYIESPLYDPCKATKALFYMRQEGFSLTKLDTISASFDRILREYKITIEKEIPDRNLGLDEKKLAQYIKTKCTHKRFESEEFYEKRTERDVHSIIFTYEKRKNLEAKNFIDAKYLFITENPILPLANKNMLKELKIHTDNIVLSAIPETLLCSYLWLGSPEKAKEYMTFELLATALSAISPTPEIIQKVKIEIQKLYDNNNISKDDYQIMAAEYLIKDALSEKTLNNPANLNTADISGLIEYAKNKLAIDERQKRKEVENTLAMLSSDTEKRNDARRDKAEAKAKKDTDRHIYRYQIFFILLHIILPAAISGIQYICGKNNILINILAFIVSIVVYYCNIEKEFSLSNKRKVLQKRYLKKWYEEYELDTSELEKI